MSIGGYFVTDEQEKARRYDLRQKGLELKKHLATLNNEMKDHAVAWKKLGDTFSASSYTFKVESDQVRVTYPDPNDHPLPGRARAVNTVTSVSAAYFNSESLDKLFRDLEETKKALDEVKQHCKDMGDPLDNY